MAISKDRHARIIIVRPEITLHLEAGYIFAGCSRRNASSCSSAADHTYYVSHDRFQFFELPTSIRRVLLEVRRKWAKLDLSRSVLGMVDRNLPSI